MPVQLENTTLSLSEISRLREIVLQTSIILNTEIDPFTIENLNKSDWWQYENARQVLSQTLVAEGYDALPAFSITDINNNTLATVLVQAINDSLISGGSTTLMLVPTGATESADGDYQRFTWDGAFVISDPLNGWSAKLDEEDRGASYSVQFKMPVINTDIDFVSICIGTAPSHTSLNDGSDGKRVVFEALFEPVSEAAQLVMYTVDITGGVPTYGSPITAVAPPSGTVVTLNVDSAEFETSFESETHTLSLDVGFLPPASDVLAFSASTETPVPLSIKVSATS